MEMDIEKIRHSLAHVMAEAVQHLFPGVKFGIGPAIDDGFYYDFLFPQPITNDDLSAIEKEMGRIIEKDQDFIRTEISKQEAQELFRDQPFKLELIEGLEDGTISIYKQGDLWIYVEDRMSNPQEN